MEKFQMILVRYYLQKSTTTLNLYGSGLENGVALT